jgi:uncharacterized membrane protein YdjX (TVP38/TMEM64 family)
MARVGRTHPFLKLALLVAIIAGAAVVLRATPFGEYFDRERLLDALSAVRSSVWAPLVYVVGYAAATAVALPGSVLTIVGGAVFGFGWGALLVTIGANVGASAAFLLARGLGRDGIERLLGSRLAGLDRATAQHGFVGLLILRLIPLVPFNALNFGSGLTAMRWRDYAVATVIGILPGTLVYVFFADALVQGSTTASAEARTRLFIAAGLFLVLTLIPLIARRLGFRLPSKSVGEHT